MRRKPFSSPFLSFIVGLNITPNVALDIPSANKDFKWRQKWSTLWLTTKKVITSVVDSDPVAIRMDPELLPGSGIIVLDSDPAKYEKHINKNVISLWILDCVWYCVLYDWQIPVLGRFFFLIEFNPLTTTRLQIAVFSFSLPALLVFFRYV